MTNEQIRDSNLQYNPKTLPELKALVKNVDLPKYLAAVGVKTDKVIIGELGYYKKLDTFLTEKNGFAGKNFRKNTDERAEKRFIRRCPRDETDGRKQTFPLGARI